MISLSSITYIVRTAFIVKDFARRRVDAHNSSFSMSYDLPPLPIVPDDSPAGKVYLIYANDNNWEDGSPYYDVLSANRHLFTEEGGQGRLFRTDADPEAKILLLSDILQIEQVEIADEDIKQSSAELTLATWASGEDPQRRSDIVRLALRLSEVALDFLQGRIDGGGLRPHAQMVVASVANGLKENITALLDDETYEGEGRRVAQLFLETVVQQSLHLAGSRPDLFTDEVPVQALITSVIHPLAELNRESRESDRVGFSLDRLQRLRETLRGPVPVSVLTAIKENKSQLFSEDILDQSRPLGIVTASFFNTLASDVSETADARRIFTPNFVSRIYSDVLTAVGEAPDAFVRGTGQAADYGRDILTAFTNALREHGLQGSENDASLAQSLVELGFDLTRKHAALYLEDRLKAEIGERFSVPPDGDRQLWSVVQMRIVAHIAGDIVSLVREGQVPNAQSTILDFVSIVADEVSSTPSLLLGSSASQEVTNITRGVAAFIASEHAALLSPADWKRVAATAVRLAIENPGRLFNLDEASPEKFLAVSLVQQFLSATHTSLVAHGAGDVNNRRGGQILFGQTIVEALEGVLGMAASYARDLANPQNAQAFKEFLKKMADLAANPEGQLSAREWLGAIRWFGAEAISTGKFEFDDTRLVEIARQISLGQGPPSEVMALPEETDLNVATPGTRTLQTSDIDFKSVASPEHVKYQPVSHKGAQG